MIIKAIIAFIITLAILGTTSQIIWPPVPRLLYNPSSSAAIGWYHLRPNEVPKRSDQVAAFAPPWARTLADERGYLPSDYPLIKTVWAVAGEQVCYNTQSVSVPKRPDIPVLGQDVLGRDMPQKAGCHVLKEGEYLLISPDVQTGFDSRYFGPVGKENIIGVVQYIGDNRSLNRNE
jgi:conjugative transfer signal peptidase TraF